MATIKDRILSVAGLVTSAAASAKALRAYEAGFDDGGNDDPVSGTTASFGYRASTQIGKRDYSKVPWDSIVSTVWSVYKSNPVGKRAVIVKRDHILGDGVSYNIEDKNLADVVDRFRQTNKFDQHLKNFIKQLYLFGVQCYPVFVRETDGQVRLGYIDPGEIETVITHPQNNLEMWAIVTKRDDSRPAWAGGSVAQRVYRIVRQDEGHVIDTPTGPMVMTPNHPDKLVTADQARLEPWELAMLAHYKLARYSGSCFYQRANHVSNQTTGDSDLLQVVDWLDQQDATLFGLADREQMAGYFFADVTLEGADDDEVKRRAKSTPAPARGSVNFHNDKEDWNLQHPDLKQHASVATAEALFDHAWGGLGYPRHWYVQGDGTNRATAQEQRGPVERSLQSDQEDCKLFILNILNFVRDQAEIAGFLRLPDEGREIDIDLPEIQIDDSNVRADTLSKLVGALVVAVDEGFMTHDNAVDMWAKALAEAGLEIDTAEIKALDPEMTTAEAANRYLRERLDAASD